MIPINYYIFLAVALFSIGVDWRTDPPERHYRIHVY